MAIENAAIFYGRDPDVYDYNFAGDGATVQAYSEDADFPDDNVQQYDLGEPWKSLATGASWVDGPIKKHYAWIRHGFPVSTTIGVYAILKHNFLAMKAALQAASDLSATNFVLMLEAGDVWAFPPPYPAHAYSVDLTNLFGKDIIVHRPQVAYKYWSITVRYETSLAWVAPAGEQWSIGRLVLAGNPFQPTFNYRPDWASHRHDPSKRFLTQGRAPRITEEDQYRSLSLVFDRMLEIDWHGLEEVYARQGVKRPVFVLPSPHLVKTGTDVPGSTDLDRDAMYGRFPAIQSIVRSRANDYGTVVVEVTEETG